MVQKLWIHVNNRFRNVNTKAKIFSTQFLNDPPQKQGWHSETVLISMEIYFASLNRACVSIGAARGSLYLYYLEDVRSPDVSWVYCGTYLGWSKAINFLQTFLQNKFYFIGSVFKPRCTNPKPVRGLYIMHDTYLPFVTLRSVDFLLNPPPLFLST